MSINLLHSRLKPDSRKTNLLILVGITLAIIPPLISLALHGLPKADSPTGSYLNPLPRGQQADAQITKPLAFYLGTAQTSLETARQLANSNPHQSPQDKQQIVTSLNQAMAAANQAINFYPKDPRAYQQRAAILFSVAHLNSSAKTMAEHDLKTAQSLANSPVDTNLPSINPLDALPIEKAQISDQNLVIASPSETPSPNQINTQTSSNVAKGQVTLLSGQTQMSVQNSSVKPESAVYLIPQENTQNHTLYVKSKSAGEFVIIIDKPVNHDLNIDYWIINQ